jgi:hypothetical protein
MFQTKLCLHLWSSYAYKMDPIAKLSLQVVLWNFVSGIQHLCYRSCFCLGMWQAPGEFLRTSEALLLLLPPLSVCSEQMCFISTGCLCSLVPVQITMVFVLCSAECWGSIGNFQEFCKHVSFVKEPVNVILIIFNWLFLCISPSLCLIGAGFIPV